MVVDAVGHVHAHRPLDLVKKLNINFDSLRL
jgi:hypothetical protein